MEKKFYPLSNPQNSIWLTEQYHQGTCLNNIGGYVLIKEDVNILALEKAINSYLEANQATRIHITKDKNGIPMQYIKDYTFCSIPKTPIENLEKLEEWSKNLIQTPFSILDSDLVSFHIFTLPNGHAGFHIAVHHLVTDAWGMSLLVSEVMENYAKLISQQEVSYLAPNYTDFIFAEKEYLASDKCHKDKEFWASIFEETPEVCNITTKKVSITDTTAQREIFSLDTKLYEQISSFCKKFHGSIYTFWLAIYSIYLAKLNHTNTSILGTPILNRTNFKEKHTSGMFISTVPLKVTIPEDSTFDEFFHQITSLQMSIFRHQKYPYAKLLEDLKKEYHFTENLYDTALSYQNARTTSQTCDVNYTSNWLFPGQSNDPLQIHFYDFDNTGEMKIFYDYQIAYLSADEIEQLHHRILHIANQILKNNTISFREIELVTPKEKEDLLTCFSNHLLTYQKEKSIIALFEEQVQRVSSATAIMDTTTKMTYQELDLQSSKLASYLQSQGIQKGDIVATLLPRSCNLIVALLAILKCGGIYLPISTTLPTERINYLLEDSAAKAIITISSTDVSSYQLPKLLVAIDTLPTIKTSLMPVSLSPQDVIYTIYTSGSTGKPKGVQITNQNLNNFLHSFEDYFHYQVSEKDICLSTTSISFDVSIWEFFFPLLNGACLSLYPEDSISDIFDYCETIIKQNITMLYIPPNILEEVYRILSKSAPIALNKILIGVEPIRFSTMAKYFTLNPDMQIVNGYGPTETTICATAYVLDKLHLPAKDGIIPIGKPLYNQKAYLVDKNFHLVPKGAVR